MSAAALAATVALSLASLWAPAARADAAPGDLDRSFGSDGIVTTAFISSGGAYATDVAFRRGLLVAVGEHGGGRFALGIYGRDGSLSFDRVTTNFGGRDGAQAVAITPGLGIVAAGFNDPLDGHANARFALARYYRFGGVNPSFGGDGKVVTKIEDDAAANAVALQGDGKIVAAGFRAGETFDCVSCADLTVARYKADGSRDSSFDGNGIRVVGFGPDSAANAVAIQADGRIVAAGYLEAFRGPDRFALVRLNPDGSLDKSFSGDGKLVTDFGAAAPGAQAEAVAIQPDGKIVVAGHAGRFFALARYNRNGSLDTSFDGDGRAVNSIGSGADRADAVAIQPDGKILAAGRTGQGGGNVALVRYLPDGDLDPSFGDVGRVITGLGGDESASGIAIQDDGKIVIAGETSTGKGRFLLARYHSEPFDDTAPETTITGPTGTSADPEPSFELGSSAPGSSFECELDGAGFTPCSSPHAVGPLADGEHTLRARATDEAGNTDSTPASHTFTVDTAVPETAIDSGPAGQTSDPTPAFTFSSPEQEATFECAVDGGALEPCASPLTLDPLADGPHTFYARAVDAAGNVDPTPAQRAFTVDTSPPGGGTPPDGGTPPGGSPAVACPAGTSASVVCTRDRRGRTIFAGTRQDETFVGTRGRDLMLGAGGDDRLRGRRGRDDLRGGPGRDELRGGRGRDVLRGGKGGDVVQAGRGGDRLFGGAGADVLRGAAGRDTLTGGRGKDTLLGGRGQDVARGGPGNDTCRAERRRRC